MCLLALLKKTYTKHLKPLGLNYARDKAIKIYKKLLLALIPVN